MASILTREKRTRLWAALSDAFVDNEVDYSSIARQLAGFDLATIEVAFFEEVAPVCYLRHRLKDEWLSIERELDRQSAADAGK